MNLSAAANADTADLVLFAMLLLVGALIAVLTVFSTMVSIILAIRYVKYNRMQNSMNISASEVISTYVYKAAFAEGKYDYSTAINLFSSVVNFALLISVNLVARQLSDTSLF